MNLRTWHHPSDVEATKYLSLALVVSRFCFMYTRSPMLRVGACGASPWGALERELGSWLDSLTSSWRLIRVRSSRGSCSPVTWSRCVHISREDKPSWRIRELRTAVAKARVNFEMGPPPQVRSWGFPTPTLVQLFPPQDFCFCFWLCQVRWICHIFPNALHI